MRHEVMILRTQDPQTLPSPNDATTASIEADATVVSLRIADGETIVLSRLELDHALRHEAA